MTTPRNCHDVAVRPLVYDTVESRSVLVTPNLPYPASGNRALRFDLYRPAHTTRPRTPVVLLTTGFSDVGMQQAIGCPAKEMQSYRSWARLIAGAGMVAITYTNQEPAEDAHALVEHLDRSAEALDIDASRIGLWSCSGNVPTALSLLMTPSPVFVCAALLYGYMLDLEGSTAVADAARTWHFTNPNTGRGVDDLPTDVPLLVVRAGRDAMAGLNESIDRFVIRSLAVDRPITLVNLHGARHGFDTVDDVPASRHAIASVLFFLRHQLTGEPSSR